MEPNDALPHSQTPATCPYPERDTTSPSHTLPLLVKIYFNIIVLSTPTSSKWCLFLSSPHKNTVCPSSASHTCHMTLPSHSWFDDLNVWWGAQDHKTSLYAALSTPRYLVLSKTKYLPQHPILKHPQPMFRPSEMFRNIVSFCGKDLLAPRPTPNLEDHPVSAVRNCLFNIFATTSASVGRSANHNVRTCHAVLTILQKYTSGM